MTTGPHGDATPAVRSDDRGAVRTLRLDRPTKLNALDESIRVGLERSLRELEDRPDIRVLVIAGTGRSFSAGADLAAGPPDAAASTWTGRRHAAGAWQRLLDLLERVPQATVASIHGHCYGGAALLAVSCDIRIAADDVQVRIPELALGIPLTWAGVPRLAREVGLPLARDLVMTGRTLDAGDALRAGFVQRVAPAAELAEATAALVGELTAMPAGPLAMTRALFAALGRDRLGPAGWADADVLSWSRREPEGIAAAQDYVRDLARARGRGT
ncbi:MAG TPA: enoyl-CoA hydratase/isomerase family protein [Acidimicrobiales bacterium]